jgi:hypothetical protein
MKIALCLGGASCVWDDIDAALKIFTPDYVVACNDIGAEWPHRLDAWVTLHPEKMADWRDKRRANGYETAKTYLVHGDNIPDWMTLYPFMFPEQRASGSSGLFTAKAALAYCGADMAVLCGIPMDSQRHFFDDKSWTDFNTYKDAFRLLDPANKNRIKSMSGWTAEYLGKPFMQSAKIDYIEPKREPIMSTDRKTIYEPHPVTPERKAQLQAKGYRIVDIVHKPVDYEGNDEATTPADVVNASVLSNTPNEDLSSKTEDELRDIYKAKFGKDAHHKMTVKSLIIKISAED